MTNVTRSIRRSRSKVLDKTTIRRRRAASRKKFAEHLQMPCENHGVKNCPSCKVP